MIRNFRQLDVWKKADELAHKVFDLTETFPHAYRLDLAGQLRRASLSVPVNIAEGCATLHTKELLQFINVARRSASETQYLLLFACKRSLVTAQVQDQLDAAYEEIQRMLNGLANSLRRSQAAKRRAEATKALSGALLSWCLFTGHWPLTTDHWPLATGHWTSSLAYAAVPRTIHYQGKLAEPDGTPLSGTLTVTVRLYDAVTAGAKLWEEQHEVTLTKDDQGIFAVTLGSQTPFGSTITFNDPLWLTVEINGGGELLPRQAVSAASYAINADLLDGVDVGTTAKKIVQLDASAALPAVSGANLTALNASNLASGTVPDGRLSSSVSLLGSSIETGEVADSSLTAADTTDTFLAAGSGVTVTKSPASWTITATGVGGGDITGVTAGTGLTGGGTSGDVTVDVGAGPGILVAADTVSVDVGTGANQIPQLDGAGALPAVSGVNLTNLHASNLASGTVADARLSASVSLLGAAIESAEVTDTTLTAADTTDTFLTAGSGVTVTKGASSWDISSVGSGGDVTAVTAGAGLTGGGTSGDVTLDVGAGTGLVVAADAVSVDVGTTANKIVQLDGAGSLPAVSGTNLTSLNAANVTSGTLPDARLSANVSLLGSAIESGEVADSTLTAMDTTDTFLAAGSGITVTKGAASWTVASTGGGGDITGVIAGTGLTGGGTSGDVTVSLATPVAVADGGTGATTAASARANLINCMPIGGVDEANQNATFQVATFAGGSTTGRPDHLWPVPVGGTVDTLQAFVGAAPGAGDTWTVTVRQNDANTALSCTISGASQTSCTDSGPVTFAAGDRLGAQFVETGTAANTAGAGWSACFVP